MCSKMFYDVPILLNTLETFLLANCHRQAGRQTDGKSHLQGHELVLCPKMYHSVCLDRQKILYCLLQKVCWTKNTNQKVIQPLCISLQKCLEFRNEGIFLLINFIILTEILNAYGAGLLSIIAKCLRLSPILSLSSFLSDSSLSFSMITCLNSCTWS